MTQRRVYQNKYPYLVTTNVVDRAPIFNDSEYARVLHKIIIDVCDRLRCHLYAFCIMPDHVHLLIQTTAGGDVSKILQQIKSLTAKELRNNHDFKQKFWQNRFYHKIIRSKIGVNNVIKYIRENPLKWGLDRKYIEKPYMYLANSQR